MCLYRVTRWRSKSYHNTPAYDGSTLEGTLDILGTLVHELVHAVDNCESGHGEAFKRCALAVGLTPPMRSTGESQWLKDLMTEKIVKKLGLFPHQKLMAGGHPDICRAPAIEDIKNQ